MKKYKTLEKQLFQGDDELNGIKFVEFQSLYKRMWWISSYVTGDKRFNFYPLIAVSIGNTYMTATSFWYSYVVYPKPKGDEKHTSDIWSNDKDYREYKKKQEYMMYTSD